MLSNYSNHSSQKSVIILTDEKNLEYFKSIIEQTNTQRADGQGG